MWFNTESIRVKLLSRVQNSQILQGNEKKSRLKTLEKRAGKSFQFALLGIVTLLTFRAIINYVTPALNLLQNPNELYRFVILLKDMFTLSNIILGVCVFIFFKVLDDVSSKNSETYKKFIFAWSVFGVFYVLMLINSSKNLMLQHLPRILLSLLIGSYLIKVISNRNRNSSVLKNLRISTLPKLTRSDFPFVLITLFVIRVFKNTNASTDSLLYWTGLADKWLTTWPSYPEAFGPGLGSDMSFNYLNLNSGIILFISLSTSLSLLNSSNILLLLTFATIFVALKVLKLQYEKWIYLLILSVSAIQINSFAKNGYLILFALVFLFAIVLQKKEKITSELSLLPGTISLIGPIGLIYSVIFSLILLTSTNLTLASKLKKMLIGYIPLFLGFIFFFLRSNSIFFPFVVWPAHFDTNFLSELSISKNMIFQNSLLALGPEVPSRNEFYLLYKYFLINTEIAGGFLLLLTFAFWFRLKNKITDALLICVLVIITALLVSQLFWQRYLIGVIAICLAIICTKLNNSHVNVWVPLKIFITVVICLKYFLIIGGQTTDSYQASSSTNDKPIKILDYKDITDHSFNMISEFGSRPKAWSDVSQLISKGNNIYLIDEIGSSLIENQKQITSSKFPINPISRKNPGNLLAFTQENNLSHVFISSEATKLELLTRYPYPDAFENSNNSDFKPCASWPSNSKLPPHVLWQSKLYGENCHPSFMYFVRASEIKTKKGAGPEFQSERTKYPTIIHASYIVSKPGLYQIEFETNAENFFKEIYSLSPTLLFRENFKIEIISYYGLNMKRNFIQQFNLLEECPDARNCKLELKLNDSDQILQINLIGFKDLQDFTIRKMKNST